MGEVWVALGLGALALSGTFVGGVLVGVQNGRKELSRTFGKLMDSEKRNGILMGDLEASQRVNETLRERLRAGPLTDDEYGQLLPPQAETGDGVGVPGAVPEPGDPGRDGEAA